MYTENKEKFLELAKTVLNEEEIQKIMVSYDNLEKIAVFFKEKYNLEQEDVETLAEKFSEKRMLELSNNDDFLDTIENNPAKIVAEVYQEFLDTKNYPENIIEDLTLVMNFVFKLVDEKIK